MKKLFILTIITFVLFSCEEVLDKEPLDMISDAQVWDDPALIEAQLNFLYQQIPSFMPHAGGKGTTHMALINLTDESRNAIGWAPSHTFTQGIINPENCNSLAYLHFWGYNAIRNCNDFLIKIQEGNVDDEIKKVMSSEVRYLRAWAYYNLVIRYGGVPLITEPQGLEDDLFVFRNKEDEIYEFIRTELDDITELLPETTDEARANKWVALALKSRAMLHAASIGKYGSVQKDGLVGVPADKEEFYFQESLDASNEILSEGPFSLYERYEDKARNYQMLFLEEDHEEIIYAEKYDGFEKGHNTDIQNQPISYKSAVMAVINPTLEMVNEYEFIDGRPGNDINYDQEIDTKELFKDKEPRFHASILHNQSFWIDDTVETYYFTVENDLSDQRKNGLNFRGKDVNNREAGGTQTGFCMKKHLQEKRDVGDPESSQDYIIFRLGEIYLNHAEAALQLGHTDDALTSLNKIRKRAGVPEKTSLTMDDIKHERRIELAFEGFRMWDARRWRDAVDDFSGVVHKLTTYYISSKGTYGYIVEPAEGNQVRLFQEQNYYNPIYQDYIFENPNLEQNPGY